MVRPVALALALGAIVLSLAGCSQPAQSAQPVSTPADLSTSTSSISTYNVRYCEIIPIVREGTKLIASIYNTLGLNDCPAEQWAQLSATELEQSLGAERVLINGPRYWVMDELRGGGATTTGETREFGGIAMTQRSQIEFGLLEPTVGDELYTPNTVQRTTAYLYKQGTEVYELTAPDGAIYIMQSYAQLDDPNLMIEQLAALGTRLTPPEGWSYTARTLDADLLVSANGTTTCSASTWPACRRRSPSLAGISSTRTTTSTRILQSSSLRGHNSR